MSACVGCKKNKTCPRANESDGFEVCEDKDAEVVVDERVVYGACCVWWDSIYKVKVNTAGLPCCPFCSSVLLEVENEKKWYEWTDKYEADGHRGYRKFIEWLRGKCFPTMRAAALEYEAKTGEIVII